ncbi:MAG: hypothetical protein K0Q73_9010 [Paenibacillus sp.]|nr:hypothetical protein [Paenibacillus sp.]
MKKPLWIGLVILVVIVGMSVVAWDYSIAFKLTPIAGFGSLLLGALCSGALIDPDSRRADIFTENKVSMNRRIKYSTFFVLIGLPNVLAFVLLYIWHNFGMKWFGV